MTKDVAPQGRVKRFCASCGRVFQKGFVPFCDLCGGMGEVGYDLTKVDLYPSGNPYVRFKDLLPVEDASVLPEDATFTPTIHARKLGRALGLPRLYLKEETSLPTGTTKDRMASVGLAFLRECGVRTFCTSSTGNSSTAYAHAIERFSDMTLHLFTAADFGDRVQLPENGRVVHFVLEDATFVEAFAFARVFAEINGFVSERGFFNPGRREGLKLAWLEAVDQVPEPIDWYVQAVSSAMGVYGVDKGAKELHAMGRISQTPKLLCVQQETCAPMVNAWNAGSEVIQPEHVVKRPAGIAKAILRGDPSGVYPHVRRIVRESGGTFVAVSEEAIRDAQRQLRDLEGVSACFSASTALAGLASLAKTDAIDKNAVVLVNVTGKDREPATSAGKVHRLKRDGNGWVPEESVPGVRFRS